MIDHPQIRRGMQASEFYCLFNGWMILKNGYQNANDIAPPKTSALTFSPGKTIQCHLQ